MRGGTPRGAALVNSCNESSTALRQFQERQEVHVVDRTASSERSSFRAPSLNSRGSSWPTVSGNVQPSGRMGRLTPQWAAQCCRARFRAASDGSARRDHPATRNCNSETKGLRRTLNTAGVLSTALTVRRRP